MIKITSGLDAESFKEFGKSSRILSWVAMILGLLGIIGFGIEWALTGVSTIVYIMIFTATFILGLVFFIMLRTNSKKLIENNYVNDFTFEDDAFNVTTHKNGEVISTRKIYYKEVSKIKESDLYLFIYVDRTAAFVVKKQDASKEDFNEVLNLINNGMKK